MKNFTNNLKQFTSRLSARWLIMALMLLLGTSSAWATRVYYVNTNGWTKINCYAWEKSSDTNEKEWPGTDITANKCSFQVAGYDVYYYETQKTKSDYCIFNNGSSQTADLEIANCTNVKDYLSNYAWMFYITQSYGGTLCLKADNNSVGNSSYISSGKAYVVVTKSEVLDKTLKVSNNCGSWVGAGDKKGGVEVGTEEVHPGCSYEAAGSSSITKASTLTSLSIASSISKSNASAVSVTAKSSSANSSYGNALKAQYFVDNTFVAESANLSTSGTTTTLDLSSFADGEHTLSVILTDGTISYPDAKTATFTIISCTKSVSGEAGLYSNGTITLSAEFNTCGSAFIGFQWKEKNSDWCYEDNSSNPCFIPLGPNNKSNETVTTTVNKSGGTFVFRPYIVVGSTAQEWLYGTEFEVATCTSINDFTLTFEDGNELGLANNTQANLSTDAEVNWSSTNNQIASVSNSGVVTGYKWGTATITATTTGNDEYCANQPASADITIKEFPRISISGTTPFCGETTELTASIDNISNDNTEYTISWYKEGDANVKGTGATFNASEGVYYAKVTGDFLETATSDQLTVTKKSTPTVANFNYEAPDNLEYNSETKTATVIWNSTQGGAITIAYSSSNPAVTLVDPINVGTYYVFVSTVEDEDFCAVSNLYINQFTITEANQTALFISNEETTFCGFPANDIELNVTGGTTSGAVTYSLDNESVATIVNNKLHVVAEGTVNVTATMAGNSNYKPVTSEAKSFTFYKAPEAPTANQVINLVKCGDNTENGSITINGYNSEYTYSIAPEATGDAQNGYSIATAGDYVITVTRRMNETCTLSTSSASISVGLTDNTPAATVTISGHNDACRGKNIELTCNITDLKGEVISYQWYKGETPIENANSEKLTIENITEDATYSVGVTLENEGCTKPLDKVSYDVTVVETPNAPIFDPESMSVCSGVSFDLPRPTNLGEKEDVVWSIQNVGITKGSQTITETTTYLALIQNEVGCTSEVTNYTVTVNPLPTITSISGNDEAVKYEDVELTANGENIADVEWSTDKGSIREDDTDPKKAILTYDQTGAVTVTAKAISAYGCETTLTKEVTFSAENCESTTTTVTKEVIDEDKMEIWCREDGSNVGAKLECYAWDKNQKLIFGAWNGTTTNSTETYDGKTYRVWEINNISSEYTLPIKVIFSYQEGNSTYQTDDLETGDAGHKYTYWFKKDGDGNSNKGKKETVFKKGDGYDDSEIKKTITTTTTIPATITAPAVKIESVTTTTGLGNINFTGRVVKKGCDDTNEYGFQYSTDRQNWTTVKVGENASAGTPFSDNTIKGLDGIYYIRAYITNDHSTQTSAEKEIRLQTSTDPISNVSIEFVAAPGENNVPSAYCVGSTAYIKATYDGAKYTQFECKSDQGVTLTELGSIPDVFQFTVKGNDNIVLMLRNIYNREGEFFSNDPPLVVNATPEPIAPTISLDKSTLCSNDDEGATISLANTVVGQTYSLFKEIENDDDTQIGNDIECTEQNKESISFNLKGLDVAGRYYVIAKENVCNRTIGTTSVTLEVVNTTGLSISIEPNTAVVTPWEPVKLKITATEGYQYNVTGLDGMVYTVNGDTYTVKIPLPEGGTRLDDDGNVLFYPIEYTISATLITGGDNQCINPAICTITLTPYLEPCTQN